jgi:hypothetical protein
VIFGNEKVREGEVPGDGAYGCEKIGAKKMSAGGEEGGSFSGDTADTSNYRRSEFKIPDEIHMT